jgi:hypothetical protein
MSEPTSLRPEDLKVETYQDALRQFKHIDQDPSDPASGVWDVKVRQNTDGTSTITLT